MVPGDGAYEKLEHQSRFLRERGLTSPEMEECNRRLGLVVRLAGGNSTKLDPELVDGIHAELADAAMKQLQVLGLFEEWLDSWDVHNGIEVELCDEHPSEVSVAAEPATVIDESPVEQVRALAAELREILRSLNGEPAAGISEVVNERH